MITDVANSKVDDQVRHLIPLQQKCEGRSLTLDEKQTILVRIVLLLYLGEYLWYDGAAAPYEYELTKVLMIDIPVTVLATLLYHIYYEVLRTILPIYHRPPAGTGVRV